MILRSSRIHLLSISKMTNIIAVRKYLLQAKLDKQDSAAVTYDKLTKAVESAAEEVLPKTRRKVGVQRKVSLTTRNL